MLKQFYFLCLEKSKTTWSSQQLLMMTYFFYQNDYDEKFYRTPESIWFLWKYFMISASFISHKLFVFISWRRQCVVSSFMDSFQNMWNASSQWELPFTNTNFYKIEIKFPYKITFIVVSAFQDVSWNHCSFKWYFQRVKIIFRNLNFEMIGSFTKDNIN